MQEDKRQKSGPVLLARLARGGPERAPPRGAERRPFFGLIVSVSEKRDEQSRSESSVEGELLALLQVRAFLYCSCCALPFPLSLSLQAPRAHPVISESMPQATIGLRPLKAAIRRFGRESCEKKAVTRTVTRTCAVEAASISVQTSAEGAHASG